ncbi:MAG TPA: phytanoyl-CoA dioxygenase family protein [Anaerolineales bacterium]|nr:phytanoyl-CoA dioxygenase family protein [Anaerolineales bacterium]
MSALATSLDIKQLSQELYEHGITNLPGILPVKWADELDEDVGLQFLDALKIEGGEGVAFRGWSRYYIEMYPERLRGFVELVTHPAIVDLSREMLTDEYEIVELGADIPLPGAPDQPPHRDFPLPEPTRLHRRLTSLCFNASTVDVTPSMGPFHIAPGTHLDDGADFVKEMFPVGEKKEAYNQRMVPRLAKRGSVSARSGLTLHRGSTNNDRMRPVIILGVVSREDRAHSATTLERPADYIPPTLKMSQAFYDSLDEALKQHLSCEIVADVTANLPPLKTPHSIEGLVMGKAPM